MVRPIEVLIVGDESSLSRALGKASAQVDSFAGRMQRAGRGISNAGHALTRNLTLPLVVAGGAAIKTAADFDSSLERIQGLVGANQKQMEGYRNSILSLAPAVAKGPRELADALYFVTSSGFKGAQALNILAASARASTAGLGDTQTIADLVTSAMTAYGAKTLSAARATDILVAATKAGKGDPQEFAQALQLNVAAADTLGISFDQLAAATAALSTVNSNVSEDATQLSGIMQALIKPSKDATKELHHLGLSAAELRTEVRDKGLLTTLLDLKNRTHDNVDELGKLFPNVRGLRGFLTLVGTAAQRNVSIFDQVAHSTGDMSRAFHTALTNDPKVQMQKLTAQLQVLGIVVGETLIPVLLRMAGGLVSVANKFKGLSGGEQTFVLIGAAALAALGPILTLGGHIVLLGSYMLRFAKWAKVAAAAEWLLNAALTANPVLLITVGIIALGVALVIAYKKSATFRAIVQGALHAVGTAVDWVRAHWRLLLALIPVIGPLLAVVATHWNTVKQIAGAAIDFVKSHWRLLVGAITTILGPIAIVISHWGTVRRVGTAAFSAVSSAISGVVGTIQTVISWVNSLIGVLRTAASLIGGLNDNSGTSPTVHGSGQTPGGHRYRASGGPVTAGRAYIVGERRPELFIPNQSGRILPTVPMAFAGGGGGGDVIVNVTLNVPPWQDAQNVVDQVARTLAPRIKRYLQ